MHAALRTRNIRGANAGARAGEAPAIAFGRHEGTGPSRAKHVDMSECSIERELRVRDVMSRGVVSVDATCLVHDVLALAADRQMHHFPVLAHGRLVGFVCTCDLYDALSSDVVGSRMHTEIATVGGETSTRAALNLMNRRAVGSLLVVEGPRIDGIVTRSDLAKASANESPAGGARCSRCHTQHRLRTARDGRQLCAECGAGARFEAPLETGAAD